MDKRLVPSDPFSIIIPVYNEEDLIVNNTKFLISYLDGFKIDYEIIIGSNGSTDSTVKLGKQLQQECEQVVFFHIPHKGVGNAFIKAASMAKYNNLISVDMDLSIEIDFIRKSLALLKNYDIVIGSKKLGKQKRSFIRKWSSYLFLLCVKFMLHIDYGDYSMASKAYRKDIIIDYCHRIDHGVSYVLDLAYLVNKAGGKVIAIPVTCKDCRKSKFNLIHYALYNYTHLFKLWLFHK